MAGWVIGAAVVAIIWIALILTRRTSETHSQDIDSYRHQPELWRSDATSPVQIRVSYETTQSDEEDDEYRVFVDEMWRAATLRLAEAPMLVNGTPCWLQSLTAGSGKRAPYVNLYWGPGRIRKTFVGDSRHRWEFDGHDVEPEIFRAMIEGRASLPDLKAEAPAKNLEEALLRDRADGRGRKFGLEYRDRHGVVGWRIISRLQRGPEELYALCHLRWGASRSFRYDNILTLADIETGETVNVSDYAARRIDLPTGKKARTKKYKTN